MFASVYGPAGLIVVLLYICFAVLFLIAWVKIITKAGYSGWWVLTGLVPLVNIIMFFVFAFSQWPVLKGSSRL